MPHSPTRSSAVLAAKHSIRDIKRFYGFSPYHKMILTPVQQSTMDGAPYPPVDGVPPPLDASIQSKNHSVRRLAAKLVSSEKKQQVFSRRSLISNITVAGPSVRVVEGAEVAERVRSITLFQEMVSEDAVQLVRDIALLVARWVGMTALLEQHNT